METGGQGRGKGRLTPSSSKSKGRMTTRYRRKKEEEKSSRKEEHSKRLRLHLDHQGGLNNDIVLTEGTMRIPFEAAEHKVKIEEDLTSLGMETGSGHDTGHLSPHEEVPKIENPDTFPANEVVLKEEVHIPNDGDQEEELGGESNLLPGEPVADYECVSVVEADFGTVQKENEELRKLLLERDLEIKRLRVENQLLKLSSSNDRQVSPQEDVVVSNVDTGEEASTQSAIASVSGQCDPEACQRQPSPAPSTETLEIDIEQHRTLLAQKEAERCALRKSQLEGDMPRGIGTSKDKTLEMEKIENARRKGVIENYLRCAAEKTRTPPLGTPEEKVLQLFPDIIKIIIQNEQTVANFVNWKKLKPLLTACRPVCKSWKESVDRIMQQDSSHFDLRRIDGSFSYPKRDFTPCPLRISYNASCKSGWAGKIDQIRCQLRANPSYNPIPSRHLILEGRIHVNLGSGNSKNWTKYCQIVKSFLQQVGKQVWYLTVDFTGGGYTHTSRNLMVFCRSLSEWFSLLPNLRSLTLRALLGPLSEDSRKALDKISFSKWEQLETLVVSSTQETHLYYFILMNNSHVKRLAMCPRSAPSPVSMELELPNLTTLKCSFYDVEDWEKFVNSGTWKFQDLSVQFRNSFREKPRLTAAQFAEGVAKFASTLTSLTFSPSEIGTGTGEDLELVLPQLKSLHLAIRDGHVFPPKVRLSPLVSLESVSMELMVRLTDPVSPHLINLRISPDYYDDKEWMQLPNLRNVNISFKVDGMDIGERDLIVKRRENMRPVIFSVPKKNHFWIKRL